MKNRDLLFTIKVRTQAKQALAALRGDLGKIGSSARAGSAGIKEQERALEALRRKAEQTRREIIRLSSVGAPRGGAGAGPRGGGTGRGGASGGAAGPDLASLARSARNAAEALDRVSRTRTGAPPSAGGGNQSGNGLQSLIRAAREAATALGRATRSALSNNTAVQGMTRAVRSATTALGRIQRGRNNPGGGDGGRAAGSSLNALARSAQSAATALDRIARARPPASGGGGGGVGAGAAGAAAGAAGGLNLGGLVGAGTAIAATVAYAKLSDEYKNLFARIGLVSDGLADQEKQFANVVSIANDARQSVEGIATVYFRFAQAGQALGETQQKIADVTEVVAKAATVSGGSAESINAAIMQLGQALASGNLAGEELRSIREQAPRLAQAIADGMDVPIGKLKELGSEGKLTSEVIFAALNSQKDIIEKEFATFPVTIGQALTVLRNNIQVAIGELEKSSGATEGIAKGIQQIGLAFSDPQVIAGVEQLLGIIGSGLLTATKSLVFFAQNLDKVISVVQVLLTLALARWLGAAAISLNAAAAAAIFKARSLVILSAAATGASTRLAILAIQARLAGAALLAAVGGPVGLAVIALAGGYFVLQGRVEQLSKASQIYSTQEAYATTLRMRAEKAAQALTTATGQAAVAARKNAAETRAEAQAFLDSARAALIAARAKAQAALADARSTGLFQPAEGEGFVGRTARQARLGFQTTFGIGDAGKAGQALLTASADLKSANAAIAEGEAALAAFSFSAAPTGGGIPSAEGTDKGAKKVKDAADEIKSKLESLQSSFDPLSAVAREFAGNTAFLNKALELSDEKLSQLGFTRAGLLAIQRRMIEANKEENDFLFDNIRAISEETRLLGIAVNLRDDEQKIIELENMARERNIDLTTKENAAKIEGYRKQLAGLRALRAADTAQTNNNDLRNEIEAQVAGLGLVGRAQERAVALATLFNQLQRDGATNAAALVAEYEKLLQAQDALAVANDFTERLRNLDTEIKLAGVLNSERDRASAILEYQNYLQERGLANTAEGTRLMSDYVGALNLAAEAETRARGDVRAGLREGLQQITEEFTNFRQQASDVVTDVFSSLNQNLVSFFETGKFSFSGFVRSIGRSLIQSGVNGIVGQITKSIGGLFGQRPGVDSAAPTSVIDQILQSRGGVLPVMVQNISALAGLGGMGGGGLALGGAGTIADLLGIGASSGGGPSGTGGMGGGGIMGAVASILHGTSVGGAPGAAGGASGGLLGVAAGILGAGGAAGGGGAGASGLLGIAAGILGAGGAAGGIGGAGGVAGGLLGIATGLLGRGGEGGGGAAGGLLGIASGILGAGGAGGGGAGGLLGIAAGILGGAGGGGGIMGLLSGILGGGGGGGLGALLGGAGPWGAVAGLALNFLPKLFADGGIMTSKGSVPLRKYSRGGIANSPQLAMFGEGSVPEAYVPVPSGRIPVEMSGPIGGGQTIVMNVHTRDGNSFNRSRGQIASNMAGELARQSKRNG